MSQGLKVEFPNQGWEQMTSAREEMLAAFDVAKRQSKAHEVPTAHGKVAEAEVRKWLKGFLPRKYGVTSGYVISAGQKASVKAPHFDVIIYDQLESPILWIENNPDSSAQGKSMAIPVEHVLAVLEVKSEFSTATVRAAIEHLNDLAPVMSGLDAPGERYPLHLPWHFCCGIICFELREEANKDLEALRAVIDGAKLRRFFGGMILRSLVHVTSASGRFGLIQSETPMRFEKPEMKFNTQGMTLTNTQEINGVNTGASLMFSPMEFSRIGFDLIAMMKGTNDGRVSSFYGLGT